MTTLFIESVLIGMAARPLVDWKRGPLITLAEMQMHGALREQAGVIYTSRAVGALRHAQARGHRPVIFGPRAERAALDLMRAYGFEAEECTVQGLIDSTPLALTAPWVATVAARGRAHPHAVRGHVVTVAQWRLTTARICEALRLHEMRTP
ncbi:hypothetical protein AB1K56_03270 [Microbacterium sp. BWR-S6Y]|uniref:hypothetical protein n=1 Tax=Microbacterium sp. BWR-S6Y TaxID=3232073 RepID=UPI00352966DB